MSTQDELWEKYQVTRLNSDLDKYNAFRREVGLELYREPNFIQEWARELYEKYQNDSLEKHFTADEIRNCHRFSIPDNILPIQFSQMPFKYKNITFYLFIGNYPPVISTEGPLRILATEKVRFSVQLPGSGRRWVAPRTTRSPLPACNILIDVFRETINQIPLNNSAPTISPNNFINAEELLSYLLDKAFNCVKSYYTRTVNTVIKLPTLENFQTFLIILRHFKINPFKKSPKLFSKIFSQHWFQEKLRNFSKEVEKHFAKHHIHYDVEQIWPTSITSIFNGFDLHIETGYNDTLSEDSDEEDGENRGHVGEQADKFAAILDDFDSLMKVNDKHSWSGDYEIEEVDRIEGNVAYELKAERPLTIQFLTMLLQKF